MHVLLFIMYWYNNKEEPEMVVFHGFGTCTESSDILKKIVKLIVIILNGSLLGGRWVSAVWILYSVPYELPTLHLRISLPVSSLWRTLAAYIYCVGSHMLRLCLNNSRSGSQAVFLDVCKQFSAASLEVPISSPLYQEGNQVSDRVATLRVHRPTHHHR